ncbi:MAG TPA: DUF1501 domain-containing protein [Armatimonadota bacterium]
MAITRRVFLKNGGLALAAVGFAEVAGPSFLGRSVFAAEPARAEGGRKTLVCLFQRGAVDGLNMVVPYGDADYYSLRPGIAIPKPGGAGSAIDLDGFFGLHPAMAPLKPLYDARHLAAIQACGSPDATRSHFDAQDYMESGAPGAKTVATGWLARAIRACPEDRARKTPLRAVSRTTQTPRSLAGDAEALAIPDLANFGVGGRAPSVAAGFEAMYAGADGDSVRATGRESFEAIRMLKGLEPARYIPANGADYPRGAPGPQLRDLAQLIRGNVGVEVAFTDCGGWDTHVNQGGSEGQLAARLHDLAQALFAFHTDLGDKMNDVLLLTMSEFGRTAAENGNQGTDHGHATCFLAMGGPVAGGKVYGRWPGLTKEQLNEGRDLALTSDFRLVFAEVAARHLGARALAPIFPGFTVDAAKFPGLVRA